MSIFSSFVTNDIFTLIVQNHLRDGSVIQLYHKPSMMFLCTTEGGQVRTSDKNGSEFIDYIIYVRTHTTLIYAYVKLLLYNIIFKRIDTQFSYT